MNFVAFQIPLFRKILSVFLFLFLFSNFVFAQDDAPLNIETTLVRLNIGVADKQGNPILNLSKGDFTIFEDDVKQDILRFEPTVAPFSVVLLLDSSGSTLGLRQTITQSAIRFLDVMLPEDRVAVISFNDKNEVLSDFTTKREATAFAVGLVGSAKKKGKTNLYKALDFALEKLSKEGKRRKAIVVLTDGIDTSFRDADRPLFENAKTDEEAISKIKPETGTILQQVLNAADKQGVTIYPLALPSGDPKKLADPTPVQVGIYTAARERLNILAQRTGGSVNIINRLEDMGKRYATVAAEIRTLYSVDYQSSNDKPKNGEKWRKIRLEITRPDFIAKTRPGYFIK